MKKRKITKADIQKELLKKLKERFQALAIFLSIITILVIVFYIIHIVTYFTNSNPRGGVALLAAAPVIIIFLTAFLLKLYYIDLYKIKKLKFGIIEEMLLDKEKKGYKYYHNFQMENVLCFKKGRLKVKKDVYSSSNVGDIFYLVILNNKKTPMVAYNKKKFDYRGEE